MSKSNQSVRTFVATDPKIVAMSPQEHRHEVFNNINSNKVNIDRKVFQNEDKVLTKRFKSTHKNVGKTKTFSSLSQLKNLPFINHVTIETT